MPNTINMTPPVKNIETIKLGHPITLNPQLIAPIKIHSENKTETADISNPSPIANLKGLSENERIMSSARVILFLIV